MNQPQVLRLACRNETARGFAEDDNFYKSISYTPSIVPNASPCDVQPPLSCSTSTGTRTAVSSGSVASSSGLPYSSSRTWMNPITRIAANEGRKKNHMKGISFLCCVRPPFASALPEGWPQRSGGSYRCWIIADDRQVKFQTEDIYNQSLVHFSDERSGGPLHVKWKNITVFKEIGEIPI